MEHITLRSDDRLPSWEVAPTELPRKPFVFKRKKDRRPWRILQPLLWPGYFIAWLLRGRR
jgi:hypothetical protein